MKTILHFSGSRFVIFRTNSITALLSRISSSAMAKGIQQGWPIVLSSLKSLLETGQGIDVFAKPKAA